jgi:hypothetical protein
MAGIQRLVVAAGIVKNSKQGDYNGVSAFNFRQS